MKAIYKNGKEPLIFKKGTFNKLRVLVSLNAAAVNTAISSADFDGTYVDISLTFKKDGDRVYQIFNDNLANLVTALCQGANETYVVGLQKRVHAGAVKGEHFAFIDLPFATLRATELDTINLEVKVSNLGTFSANIDGAISFVGVELVATTGYMKGVSETEIISISENTNNQTFPLGDNVQKIVLVNLDKTTITDAVINNVTLQSDKLEATYQFEELVMQDSMFRTKQNFNKSASSVLKHKPQTFVLHDTDFSLSPLDNTKITVKYNAGATAVNNFIAVTRFHTNAILLQEAFRRQEKHKGEFYQKNR